MCVKTGSDDGPTGEDDTVAAVDDIDGEPHLVVADVTRDGAWVAVSERVAAPLEQWE